MDPEHDRQAGTEQGPVPGRSGREADSTGARAAGPASASGSPGCRYAIRVEGLLDAHWSEWLGGMRLTHEQGIVTRLEGSLADQAALHGVLNKIRDLRLTLVTVERLSAVAAVSDEPPEPAA